MWSKCYPKPCFTTAIVCLLLLSSCADRQAPPLTLSEYYEKSSEYEIEVFKDIQENGFFFDQGGESAHRILMRQDLCDGGLLTHRRIEMVGAPQIDSEFYKEYERLRMVVRTYDIMMCSDSAKHYYLESWLIKNEDELLQWFVARHPEYFISL